MSTHQRHHARIHRMTWPMAATTCTAIVLATLNANAGWPACERDRVTNLVYNCVSPGAKCGANKECKDVSGWLWADCKCKASGAAITIMAGGAWTAEVLGLIVPDVPVPFMLNASPGDALEIFRASDTNEAGEVTASQLLVNPASLGGMFSLLVLAGPPDAMPAFIVDLNWTIEPFELVDQSTGLNTITLAPGAEAVMGFYNQIAGEIRFDNGLPCTLTNDLFPGGREMLVHPALGLEAGNTFRLMPAFTFTLDECFGVESFDGYDNDVSLHGLAGWKGWDDDPLFSAPVSSVQARTGSQSVKVADDVDLVHGICTPGSGAYQFTAWQYIPPDFSAPGQGPQQGTWFVLLNEYQDNGPYDWAMQMQFNPNLGLIKVFDGDGNNAGSVPYDTDRWVKIQVIIDLDEDWTRIYYDDDLVTEYSWTGGVLGEGGGALDVAAVDLFANGSSQVFYDDLLFERIELAEPCPADLVDSATFQPPPDGAVDGADLAFLLGEWGRNPGSPADLVTSATFEPPPDGFVDGADLAVLLGEWGVCP